MAQPVPQFGDWENSNFTQAFEIHRKEKAEGVAAAASPNNSNHGLPSPKAEPKAAGSNAVPPPVMQENSPRPPESPLPRGSTPRKPTTNPRPQQSDQQGSNGISSHRRPKVIAGDRSPLHPTSQPKATKRTTESGHVSSTPGRGKYKNLGRARDENIEDDMTVPAFGDWDETRPESGKEFTGIFSRIKQDHLSPQNPVSTPNSSRRSERKPKNSKWSCFGFF